MSEHQEKDGTKDGPDPARFFSILARENPPEEFWAGFWPFVRAGIREAEMRPAERLGRGRALLLGASAGLMAAAAVLVAAFLVVPTVRIPVSGGRSTAVAVVPALSPTVREAPSPPILEDLRSASARVYTFHVGEPADSTDVILIVDESLDI
jgi:hypothetical protein